MKYNKVDSGDALLLVRSMGLLLNQAAVYGPVHNVTNAAINRVYQEICDNLNRYGALEFTVNSNLICVNGYSGDLDSAASAGLVRRFAQLDIDGLLFVQPLSAKEFEKCIKVLAMPVALITEAAGVAELFKRELLSSVSVVNIDYKRVDEDSGESDENVFFELSKDIDLSADIGLTAGDSGTVIDLSDSLSPDDFNLDMFEPDPPDEALAKIRLERKMQSEALAALLRETAETLENNSVDCPDEQFDRMTGALAHIKDALAIMARGSEASISLLAQQVNDDKFMVAGIEAEARLKGYPLKLTREDLMSRYAELNQELIQPLTVSTGVIDMLLEAKAGTVNESQQELLRMAHESILRVNELVEYMHGIAGLPESFVPDMDLINDSHTFRNG